MAGLDYINSRGMAFLIKHHDEAKAAGGLFALAAIPDGIAATFETMGLQSTFVIRPDVDTALAGLAPAPAEAEPPAPPATDAEGASATTLTCDGCAASITADSPGKYRCPRCRSCFEVTPDGEVIAFAARAARSVEVIIPCGAAYVDVARAAASSVIRSIDIPSFSAEAIDRLVDEAVGLYASKAGDKPLRLRMFVAADDREFTVAFLANDAPLEITSDDKDGLTFKTLRGIVDDLEVSPVSPEGQILKLVKNLQY
jgi:hypothetical protein